MTKTRLSDRTQGPGIGEGGPIGMVSASATITIRWFMATDSGWDTSTTIHQTEIERSKRLLAKGVADRVQVHRPASMDIRHGRLADRVGQPYRHSRGPRGERAVDFYRTSRTGV